MGEQTAEFFWRNPLDRVENSIESASFGEDGVGVLIFDSDDNELLRVTVDTSLTVRVNGRPVWSLVANLD